MSDLIASLQRLGDAEHDDLSVAHDALAEIMRLRLDVVEKQDEIERLRAAGVGYSQQTVNALSAERDKLRAALIAAMEIVHSWRAINAQQNRQVPEIYEFGKKLDAVIAQADAALGVRK